MSTPLNIQTLETSDIHADDDFNCRGAITPIEVVDIAESIREKGLLQPVVVMEYPPEKQKETGKKYLLIAGYRRYTATTKILRHTTIEANIRPTMLEEDARAINLSENFQRTDLNIMQEAFALQKMFALNLTEDQVAAKIGMSRGWVQVRFLTLKLPSELYPEIAAGIFNQLQIRDLYTILKIHGKAKTFETAKEFKKAREKGETLRKNLNPRSNKQKERITKKIRKRPEIFEMIGHLGESVGMGLATRAMSWCAGEISTLDLYYSIKEHDEQYGDGNYIIDTSDE